MDNLSERLQELNSLFQQLKDTLVSIPFNELTNDQKGYIESLKDAVSAANQMNQNTKEGKESLSALINTVNGYRTSLEGVINIKRDLTQKDKDLQTTFDMLKKSLEIVTKQMQNMSQMGEENSIKFKDLKKRAMDYIAEMENLNGIIKRQNEQIELQKASNNTLKDILKNLTNEYNSLSTAEEKASEKGIQLQQTITKLTLFLKEEKNAITGVATELKVMSDVQRKLDEATSKLAATQTQEYEQLVKTELELKKAKKAVEEKAEATLIAEGKMEKAIDKTTLAYKIQNGILKDLIRLGGMFIAFPIFVYIEEQFMNLVKWLTGTSDEIIKVKDAMTEFEYELSRVGARLNEVNEKEELLNKILLDAAKNTELSFDKRTEAINKYRAAYGNLLDMYTDEQIAAQSTEIISKTTQADRLRREKEESDQRLDIRRKALKDQDDLIAKLKADQKNAPWWDLTSGKRIGEAIKLAEFNRMALEVGTDPRVGMKSVKELEKDNVQKTNALETFIYNKKNQNLIQTLRGEIAQLEKDVERRDYDQLGLTDKSTAADARKVLKTDEKDQSLQQKRELLAELLGKKDPKGRSGRKRATSLLDEYLGIQKERNEGARLDIQSDYGESRQYLGVDDLRRNQEFRIQNEENYNEKMALIEKYSKLDIEEARRAGESARQIEERELKIVKLKQDVKNERVKLDNELNESDKKIKKDMAERAIKSEKEVEQYIQHLRKSREEIEKIIGEGEVKEKQGQSKKRLAKFFNPLFSMLGLGGADVNTELREQNKQIDAAIAEKQRELDQATNDYGAEFNRKDRPKDQFVLDDAQKRMETSGNDLKELQRQKELNNIEKNEEAKRAVWKQSYDLTVNLANSSFNIQKENLRKLMQDTQDKARFEMELAGNNASAKQKIAKAEHDKMRTLRRQEVEMEKNQAAFTATVSTFAGIARAFKDYKYPVSLLIAALVGAQGFAQVNAINNKQLPGYRKGRKWNLFREKALVNEEGFELIGKDGKFRIAGDGEETVTQLEHGEKVFTHKESKDMLLTDRFLAQMLRGERIYSSLRGKEKYEMYNHIASAMVSEQGFERAMDRALKKNKQDVKIELPAQHVQDKFNSTSRRNSSIS